jgi:hypothetical protein
MPDLAWTTIAGLLFHGCHYPSSRNATDKDLRT